MTAEQRIAHHLPNIIQRPDKLTVADYCKVTIKCNSCSNKAQVSVRNLTRRWSEEPYLCKSCHVKTYIADEGRLKKFQNSFAKTAQTQEHKKRCSKAAKTLWNDPKLRQKVSKAVSEDNRTNPKKKEARRRARQAWMEKYGMEKLMEMRAIQRNRISIPEQIIASILADRGAAYEQQYAVGKYLFDFFLPDFNLLIEHQGEYWHKDSVAKDSAKATYAANMGYLVKHIWESDFNEIGKLETMIDEWLGKATYELIDFNFVDVVIKEDNNSDARKLYGRYHYLPAISKSGYHIGAWLGDEHVACATFSHVTRKQIADRLKMKPKQVRELSRFCIIPTRNKTNFASWFMSRAVSRLKTSNSTIQALISFADTTLHDGTIYEASNWKYDGLTKKNYVYRSADARFYVHKKTVWDRAKKMGMSESEYADKHNYIKAWSKPKKRYLLSL